MRTPLYPLKFHSIFKERIWGGEKLKTILNKPIERSNIGESWEISDVQDNISIVSEGLLEGKALKELLELYGSDLIGLKNYKTFGDNFPLLIKFIDAKDDLSIQLHPNDELARERHDSFGKTEMWYVMQAEKDAKLIVGFNQNVDTKLYSKHLENKTLPQILNFENVNNGDTFFIEVGRVHAIGAGVLLAEIQQTSDVTYRVYDWDRVDAQGNSRELHNDLALEAIDFNMKNDYKVDYTKTINTSNKMVKCPYFTTNFLPVNGEVSRINRFDSFIIYMCVEGEAQIKAESYCSKIKQGETVLIPAVLENLSITSENAKLLEVYV